MANVSTKYLEGYCAITSTYSHPLAGHFMVKKTIDRVRNNYYWSGYRKDVERYCKSCDLCASRKEPHKKAKACMKQFNVGEPMARCAMDILGPLPVSDKGNKYILVVG